MGTLWIQEIRTGQTQLVVDEEAAGHVREIFTMYMDGCSYSDIAKRLNTDGVLSPTLQRE